MSIIPCTINEELHRKVDDFAEVLRTQAHTLGDHGLSESDFYSSGLFRGAIERVRGQFAAMMADKREFVRHILNFLQDRHFIEDWESAGEANRHDYVLAVQGKTTVIELKGCLDGNNTTIFERPAHAEEFIIWSVCTNPGANPQHNVWSGIHTRLSAEIIARQQRVDGLIIWDMHCGTVARPCPKARRRNIEGTEIGPYRVPPPCIYLFPATIASTRNNPDPMAQSLESIAFLRAIHEAFGGLDDEINYVDFSVRNNGPDLERKTVVRRNNSVVKESRYTPLQRA